MKKVLKSKTKYGCLVELVEASGFLGGVSYQLEVDGFYKGSWSNLTEASRAYESY